MPQTDRQFSAASRRYAADRVSEVLNQTVTVDDPRVDAFLHAEKGGENPLEAVERGTVILEAQADHGDTPPVPFTIYSDPDDEGSGCGCGCGGHIPDDVGVGL